MSVWKDRPELLAKIVREYVDGDGPADIARRYRLTRNQVNAKLDREGVLRRRPSAPVAAPRAERPAQVIRHQAKVFGATNVPPLKPAPESAAVPRVAPPAVPIVRPLGSAAPRTCAWPIGHPGLDGFHFCGGRIARGSYCETHAARAYQPATKRNATANELMRSLRKHVG